MALCILSLQLHRCHDLPQRTVGPADKGFDRDPRGGGGDDAQGEGEDAVRTPRRRLPTCGAAAQPRSQRASSSCADRPPPRAAPATRRCCQTTHCHPPRHLTGCLPDRPLPSSFPDHSQTPLSISECQLAEHRKDIDQLQPLHVKQPLHRQYRVRNVCISLLHRYTYISYESSNQGLFPLSKMVVIRLVLEDCTGTSRSGVLYLVSYWNGGQHWRQVDGSYSTEGSEEDGPLSLTFLRGGA